MTIEDRTKAWDAIPPGKRKVKHVRTVLGGVVALAFLAVPKLLGYPVWFGMLGVGFGLFIASKEALVQYALWLPAAIGKIMSAGKGGGDA